MINMFRRRQTVRRLETYCKSVRREPATRPTDLEQFLRDIVWADVARQEGGPYGYVMARR